MENPKISLRYAILNKARIYKQSTGINPNYLALSPMLLKLLVGRQLAKAIQHKNEYALFDKKDFLFEIACADESFGNSFSFIGRKKEFEEYVIDYMLLNRYDR